MNLFRKFYAWLRAWFTYWWNEYQKLQLEQRTQELIADKAPAEHDAGKETLRRIALWGICPPDTVSLGVMNGGFAVFYKHDKATEIFIGNDYDHAADKFFEWLKGLQDRGPDYAPTTKTTTKLNRHDRRAYASKKFRNSQKRKKDRK